MDESRVRFGSWITFLPFLREIERFQIFLIGSETIMDNSGVQFGRFFSSYKFIFGVLISDWSMKIVQRFVWPVRNSLTRQNKNPHNSVFGSRPVRNLHPKNMRLYSSKINLSGTRDCTIWCCTKICAIRIFGLVLWAMGYNSKPVPYNCKRIYCNSEKATCHNPVL